MGAAGIDSDDFSGTFPNAFWTQVNTTGTTLSREGQGTSDARCVMAIDATNHEWWAASDNPFQLRQDCSDADFTIEAKLDVLPAVTGAEFGIFIADSANATSFNVCVYYDSGVHYAATDADTGSSKFDETQTWVAPVYLRAGYVVTTGVLSAYWSDAPFSNPTAKWSGTAALGDAAYCGLYVANWSSPANATTGKFDYFWEITDPIAPEDPTGGTRRIFIIT